LATDAEISRCYNRDMSRTAVYRAPPAGPINQWVRDALAHSGLSQAALSRELFDRKIIGNDRSIVNKMTIGRDVSAREIFAIAEITGFPAPNENNIVSEVPLLSTISAGVMMRDDLVDEAKRMLTVTDLGPGDWIALEVDGDSMDKISPPGSIIFVNRRDKKLIPNGCYIIANQFGEATYKRYRPGPPPRFEPVSMNDTHEPIIPDNEVPVIGRVKRSMIDM